MSASFMFIDNILCKLKGTKEEKYYLELKNNFSCENLKNMHKKGKKKKHPFVMHS